LKVVEGLKEIEDKPSHTNRYGRGREQRVASHPIRKQIHVSSCISETIVLMRLNFSRLVKKVFCFIFDTIALTFLFCHGITSVLDDCFRLHTILVFCKEMCNFSEHSVYALHANVR